MIVAEKEKEKMDAEVRRALSNSGKRRLAKVRTLSRQLIM